MHVAIRRVEMKLLLDEGREPGLVLHGPGGLGIVAARPGHVPLAVGLPRDQVLVPELVDRGEVGVVVVEAVAEAEGVNLAGVVGLPLVAAFLGAARVRKVKLSPSSRQPLSWSVITILVMP